MTHIVSDIAGDMDIQVVASADIYVCTSNVIHIHLRAYQRGVMGIRTWFRLAARRMAGLLRMIRLAGMLRMVGMASLRLGLTRLGHDQAPYGDSSMMELWFKSPAGTTVDSDRVKTWNKSCLGFWFSCI
jgi:hypothetical protein